MFKSHGSVLAAALATQIGVAALLVGAAPAAAQKQLHLDPPLYMQELNSFKGKTLEQKVEELADRESIRDLIAIYAHRVAHGESIAELFTEDGVWTIRRLPDESVEVVSGMKELVAHFGPRPAGSQNPLPMIHNFLIKIDGDNALGINSNELRIVDKGKSIIASGYYEDRYRRVNGKWLFARRDTTFIHWVPIQEGWARPVSEK